MTTPISSTDLPIFTYPLSDSVSLTENQDTIDRPTLEQDYSQFQEMIDYKAEKQERLDAFYESEERYIEKFNTREEAYLEKINNREEKSLARFEKQQEKAQTQFDNQEEDLLEEFQKQEDSLLADFEEEEAEKLSDFKESLGLSEDYDEQGDERFTEFLEQAEERKTLFEQEATTRYEEFGEETNNRVTEFNTLLEEETESFLSESDERRLEFDLEAAERLKDYEEDAAKRYASFEEKEEKIVARVTKSIDKEIAEYNDNADDLLERYDIESDKRTEKFGNEETKAVNQFIEQEIDEIDDFNDSEEDIFEEFLDGIGDAVFEVTSVSNSVQEVSLSIGSISNLQDGDKLQLTIGSNQGSSITVTTQALSASSDSDSMLVAIKNAIESKITTTSDTDFDSVISSHYDAVQAGGNTGISINSNGELVIQAKDSSVNMMVQGLTIDRGGTSIDAGSDYSIESSLTQQSVLSIDTASNIEQGDTISLTIGKPESGGGQGQVTVTTDSLSEDADEEEIAQALQDAIYEAMDELYQPLSVIELPLGASINDSNISTLQNLSNLSQEDRSIVNSKVVVIDNPMAETINDLIGNKDNVTVQDGVLTITANNADTNVDLSYVFNEADKSLESEEVQEKLTEFDEDASERKTEFIDDLLEEREDFIEEMEDIRENFIEGESEYANTYQQQIVDMYNEIIGSDSENDQTSTDTIA